MKKMPDARPNNVADSCRSELISDLAIPRLVRSRKLTKYSAIRIGTNRIVTRRRTRDSSACPLAETDTEPPIHGVDQILPAEEAVTDSGPPW